MLVAEPGAGAADAADHLVDMKQDVVLAADALHPVPVAFGRGDDAAARRDGFKAEAAHGVGAFGKDHLLDLVGRPFAVVLGRRPVLSAVFHAMRDADEARREGAVLHVALVLAARRHGGERAAVVIAVAVEDLVLLAAMALVRDLADHLEGLLVRLGAGIGVVDPAHARHLLDQHLGEDRAGNGPRRIGEVIHFHKLVVDRLGDRLAAVAHVHRPDATRDGVEMLLAPGVPDPHSLALDDDARIGRLEGFVLDQVMPDMGAVGLDHFGNVVRVARGVHLPSLSGTHARGAGGLRLPGFDEGHHETIPRRMSRPHAPLGPEPTGAGPGDCPPPRHLVLSRLRDLVL